MVRKKLTETRRKIAQLHPLHFLYNVKKKNLRNCSTQVRTSRKGKYAPDIAKLTKAVYPESYIVLSVMIYAFPQGPRFFNLMYLTVYATVMLYITPGIPLRE